MDNVIGFIEFLRGTSEVEINNLDNVLNYHQAIGQPNMYFVCWLATKSLKRCNDDDIKTKKYFVVDIDIRLLHYENTGIVLTQEELREKIDIIIKLLNDNWLWDYCAYADSWNGLHLYYAWTEKAIDKKTYSDWVKAVYETIDHAIRETWYTCDQACTNLARIMRLPGSINPRKKVKKDKTWEIKLFWDLWKVKCELLYFEEKQSIHFDRLEAYAVAYVKEKEQEKIDQQKIKQIVKVEYKKPEDIWKQINNVPACDIACEIRWVTIVDRGLDNVALREDKKNMWAYRYKPYNIIVNTGSSLIKTQKPYFTPYELVYYELMWQDKKRTVEYFKDKYWIIVNETAPLKPVTTIPKLEYEKQWYLYGNSTFDAFDCIMSWELLTIVSQSNTGKTTFAMDVIQENSKRGKKCFYINLEFPIETMWQSRRLYINKKKKRNMTDIDPLSEVDQRSMDKYVQEKLRQFDYHNCPNGMKIEDIIDLIMQKYNEWYSLFVIDTFSRITGNLDSTIAHTNQNRTMELLQELCQNIGIVILLLHHTNKKWEFEWSQKIMDLSNVFIVMTRDEDWMGNKLTNFELTKDKFVSRIELPVYYVNQEYSLEPPPNAF